VSAVVLAAGVVAAHSAAANLVAAVEGGPRIVRPGNEVVVDLFLELDPDEVTTGVRLELDVSNLRAIEYRQVPDLALGNLPNAPWNDVSFVSERRGAPPGSSEIAVMQRAIFQPVDPDIVEKLRPLGLPGRGSQIPLGGFRGRAAGTGEIRIRVIEPHHRSRCESPPPRRCELWIPGGGHEIATGVVVARGLAAASDAGPARAAAKPAPAPPPAAPAATPAVSAPPRRRAAPVQVAQAASDARQCRVEREQAELGLAEARRDLAQTRLELAQLRVELENAQLQLERARAEGDRSREQLAETRGRIDELEGTLDEARAQLADADGDGVRDALDRCAETGEAERVDARGCSLRQFCAAHDVREDEGRATCWVADFQNDEPLGHPADCRATSRACVAR
jgi:hypothetical protein